MNKKLLKLAALLGILGVVFGAFGAHTLEEKISADQIGTWNTAVEYQFYHTFAIFIALGLGVYFKEKIFNRAAWLFFVGVLLFSGSLYFLATQNFLGIESISKILGPMTPIGGVCFIAGWTMIMIGISKSK